MNSARTAKFFPAVQYLDLGLYSQLILKLKKRKSISGTGGEVNESMLRMCDD